ncbi:hypothetical protein B0H14DRAFT_2614878 [Mycena olivaceomarginata]|nr:hypothetical protein B0H14DRAFT_2614878 [Mycena olivaceomarginata]
MKFSSGRGAAAALPLIGRRVTAAETYCLEGPKLVADSIVVGNRFGATNTFRLRPPGTATDTPSISRNIKYTQTPAEMENIGSPETASGGAAEVEATGWIESANGKESYHLVQLFPYSQGGEALLNWIFPKRNQFLRTFCQIEDHRQNNYKRPRRDERDRGGMRYSPPPQSPAWKRDHNRKPPREKEKPAGLPTVLNWFVTQLTPQETFDGPFFNIDNLMDTLKKVVIPSSTNRARPPPPKPGRPLPDYGPYQGPQSWPPKGVGRHNWTPPWR